MDGRGDVTKTHVAWKLPSGIGFMASPLLVRREPGRERGRGRGEGETRDHVDRVVATTQPQKNPPSTGPWNWDSR